MCSGSPLSSETDTHQVVDSAVKIAGVAVLTSALAGCGGGSSGSTAASSTDDPNLAPSSTSPPSSTQAARFLQQASFSSQTEDIQHVQAQGYANWLQEQFNLPVSTSNWDWLLQQGYLASGNVSNLAGASDAIWQRLINAPDVLRQRVALALSEFFVVGAQGISKLPYRQFVMAAWWDLLCQQAFGTYRELLEAVTLNAAMGRYLNTAGNEKEDPLTGRQPDENYAREVLQLFSIGLYELNTDGTLRLNAAGQPIETYTQDTVSNLARVFTGWSIVVPRPVNSPNFAREPMAFDASKHSALEARFLGITIPANTDGETALRMALDAIAQHPNVGPFLGKQLIQRLVTSNPSPAYVARVAAAFNNNGQGLRGDLKAVIRAVLLDAEARTDANLTSPSVGKLREPMLRFIQWARSFKLRSSDGSWAIGDLSDAGKRLGQQPLNSPSVFNFFRPGYVPPNTGMTAQGLTAPEFQLVHETGVAGYLNFMQSAVANGVGKVTPDYTAELALTDNPDALMQHLNLLLCAGQMSATTQTSISNAIATINTSTYSGQKNRVYAAIFLTLACPDYLIQK